MIKIGQIVKPQGVRGEVKVKALTDDASRFSVLKTVYVGNKIMRIASVRIAMGDAYIKFDDVISRDDAEKLRDCFICIERDEAVKLSKGEFFVADLIGAELISRSSDSNTSIGKITRVDSFGAADVISVDCDNGKSMSFAFVKELAAEYSLQDRAFFVDASKLAEVAVYED